MRYQLDLNIPEEVYVDFNIFHSFESPRGKKQVCKGRIFFIAVMLLLMLYVLIMLKFTSVTLVFIAALVLFTTIYMLLYKKRLERIVKKQIKKLKSTGKLPFESDVKVEFYEDHLVEITPSARMEQSYAQLERVCIVENRFILLYTSVTNAHIFPIAQVDAQLNREEFLGFLSEKCATVEHY